MAKPVVMNMMISMRTASLEPATDKVFHSTMMCVFNRMNWEGRRQRRRNTRTRRTRTEEFRRAKSEDRATVATVPVLLHARAHCSSPLLRERTLKMVMN
jgi:hypothetical protein